MDRVVLAGEVVQIREELSAAKPVAHDWADRAPVWTPIQQPDPVRVRDALRHRLGDYSVVRGALRRGARTGTCRVGDTRRAMDPRMALASRWAGVRALVRGI